MVRVVAGEVVDIVGSTPTVSTYTDASLFLYTARASPPCWRAARGFCVCAAARVPRAPHAPGVILNKKFHTDMILKHLYLRSS